MSRCTGRWATHQQATAALQPVDGSRHQCVDPSLAIRHWSACLSPPTTRLAALASVASLTCAVRQRAASAQGHALRHHAAQAAQHATALLRHRRRRGGCTQGKGWEVQDHLWMHVWTQRGPANPPSCSMQAKACQAAGAAGGGAAGGGL